MSQFCIVSYASVFLDKLSNKVIKCVGYESYVKTVRQLFSLKISSIWLKVIIKFPCMYVNNLRHVQAETMFVICVD